jgi:hypothetical protein
VFGGSVRTKPRAQLLDSTTAVDGDTLQRFAAASPRRRELASVAELETGWDHCWTPKRDVYRICRDPVVGPRELWMSRVVVRRSLCAADSVVAHAVSSGTSSISPGLQVLSNHGSSGP